MPGGSSGAGDDKLQADLDRDDLEGAENVLRAYRAGGLRHLVGALDVTPEREIKLVARIAVLKQSIAIYERAHPAAA